MLTQFYIIYTLEILLKIYYNAINSTKINKRSTVIKLYIYRNKYIIIIYNIGYKNNEISSQIIGQIAKQTFFYKNKPYKNIDPENPLSN